jgi:hypothetical protein
VRFFFKFRSKDAILKKKNSGSNTGQAQKAHLAIPLYKRTVVFLYRKKENKETACLLTRSNDEAGHVCPRDPVRRPLRRRRRPPLRRRWRRHASHAVP